MPNTNILNSVVWVKLVGYPEWPARVVTSEEAKEGAKKDSCKRALLKGGDGYIHVRYFNEKKTVYDLVSADIVKEFVANYKKYGNRKTFPKDTPQDARARFPKAVRMGVDYIYNEGNKAQIDIALATTEFPGNPDDKEKEDEEADEDDASQLPWIETRTTGRGSGRAIRGRGNSQRRQGRPRGKGKKRSGK